MALKATIYITIDLDNALNAADLTFDFDGLVMGHNNKLSRTTRLLVTSSFVLLAAAVLRDICWTACAVSDTYTTTSTA